MGYPQNADILVVLVCYSTVTNVEIFHTYWNLKDRHKSYFELMKDSSWLTHTQLMGHVYCGYFNSSPPSAAYIQSIRSALVQIMACHLFGTKPLSQPMLGYYWLNPGPILSRGKMSYRNFTVLQWDSIVPPYDMSNLALYIYMSTLALYICISNCIVIIKLLEFGAKIACNWSLLAVGIQ